MQSSEDYEKAMSNICVDAMGRCRGGQERWGQKRCSTLWSENRTTSIRKMILQTMFIKSTHNDMFIWLGGIAGNPA